jgi:hypothetical protein
MIVMKVDLAFGKTGISVRSPIGEAAGRLGARRTQLPDCGSTRGSPARPAQRLANPAMKSHALPPEAQQLASKTFRLWQANPNHPSLRYRRLDHRENLAFKSVATV